MEGNSQQLEREWIYPTKTLGKSWAKPYQPWPYQQNIRDEVCSITFMATIVFGKEEKPTSKSQ